MTTPSLDATTKPATRKVGLPPLVDNRTEALILGSFPGQRSLDAGEYYADGRNKFWEIVEDFIGVPWLAEYSERCEALLARNLGLWDVIRSCVRDGSSDRAIKDPVPNDLKSFFEHRPQVRVVLFNGLGGDGPLKFFQQFDHDGRVELPKDMKQGVLPSSACVNSRMTRVQKAARWRANLVSFELSPATTSSVRAQLPRGHGTPRTD